MKIQKKRAKTKQIKERLLEDAKKSDIVLHCQSLLEKRPESHTNDKSKYEVIRVSKNGSCNVDEIKKAVFTKVIDNHINIVLEAKGNAMARAITILELVKQETASTIKYDIKVPIEAAEPTVEVYIMKVN